MGARQTDFMQTRAAGHVAGLFTGIVWGLTFVSTKVLLETFVPFEILFGRFFIAFLALWLVRPRILRLRPGHRADELLFAACGLTGVVAYFLLENTGLVYAPASNVSVVTSTAPLFIAILAVLFGREKRLRPAFIVGFVVAIIGIAFISFSGNAEEGFRLGKGELMAMGGAAMWGIYSNILGLISDRGYETIATIKRIFAWGLAFMVLLAPFMGLSWDFSRLLSLRYAGNLLFLGLVASGLCYITWSFTVDRLGASHAGAYIYLQPAVTIVAAMLFLGEAFTWRIGLGLVLVLAGLLLSEGRFERKAKGTEAIGDAAEAQSQDLGDATVTEGPANDAAGGEGERR